MRRKVSLVAVTAALSFVIVATYRPAAAAVTVSLGGVTVWDSETRFLGDITRFARGDLRDVSEDDLPQRLEGHPVMATESVLGAFHPDTGRLSLYTRHGDRLTPRGILLPHDVNRPVHYRLLADVRRKGLDIEAYDQDDRLEYTVSLSSSGLFGFRPGRVQALTVAKSDLAHAIVPSLIGTDLVYDPGDYEGKRELYVPSMNMIVGLASGNDCVMVGAWPTGKQLVRLELKTTGSEATIDGVTIALAAENFYLGLLEHPGIWHTEALQDGYLERDTAIDWKRPFPAKWIGHFFVESEDIRYPFYFRDRKERLWGRFMRSWYYYPCWLDGDETYIHLEKKCPPKGEMLIYYLEPHPNSPEVASPVGVLRDALGDGSALKLLDYDGIEQRMLLAHGHAVCAMCDKTQKAFEAGEEVSRRVEIESRADDVAEFIRMIRDRVFEFGDFAERLTSLLDTRKQEDPSLVGPLEMIEDTIDEIRLAAEEDLPDVSLDEVRRWTDEIKSLAQQVRPTNLDRYKVLSRQCRQIAGSQDDLARELSVMTIRLKQQAATFGVDSRDRVRLAEEIIAQSRRILRRPTWWEPRRYFVPKSNPGIP